MKSRREFLTGAAWMGAAAMVLCALAGCMEFCCGDSYGRQETFRLATFNMRTDCSEDRGRHDWTNRVPLIAKVIEDNKFDIIGAQELKENQIADLRRTLGPKGFDAVGRGRLAEGKSEGVYLLFNRNRFTLIESDTFQLSETPEVWGSTSWDSAYPRTCVWARLRDQTSGCDILVYNTHLDYLSELARQKGMELILERIKAATEDGTPAFLTGDFNCPSSPTNAVGLAKRVMCDTKEISQSPHQGPEKTFHAWNPPPRLLLDYILASGNVEILDHKTHEDAPCGGLPSDHLPVSAMVSIKH